MLAIIPARGGSKGLPGKNIKDFFGKPLIAWTIESALASTQIKKIIVSTDCEEIAAVATQFGAEVPFLRPQELASDSAKSNDVFKYTIDRIEKETTQTIDDIIVLQPTSPLRTTTHIDDAISLFKNKNADAIISYCEEHHPIRWHKHLNDNNGFVSIFNSEKIGHNRQEEQKTYYPNGAIYVLNKKVVLTGEYYTKNAFAYIMSRTVSVDIDTIEDFDYAYYLFSKNFKN